MAIENTQMGLTLGWRGNQVYLDIQLLTVSVSLVLIGYVMVCSASLHLGDRFGQDIFFYPKNQFIHILMGFIAAAAVAMIRLDYWQKAGPWLFVFGLGLLVLVLIPSLGIKVNGSSRWLSVFGIRVQVSELFKLITVIYLADYVTRHIQSVRGSVITMVRCDRWNGVIKGVASPCGLLMFGCFLLLREPNFGAAVIITLITMAMLFLAGARLGLFGLVMLLLLFFGSLLVYTSPYRLSRLIGFIDPWADPLDSGFQLSQALIAFGRGEWSGVGLGASVQKLDYLPEAHTDFLFSVIGEELGVLGVSTVIILFALLVRRAFVIGREADLAGKRFAAFLAYGIGTWFGLQSFVNMGVNMGMLPTKGLTLPLMSYGGGSMIVMCVALALMLRVHSETIQHHQGSQKMRPEW